MLSVPKSKPMDKKAGKEQKTPLKSIVVSNGGNGLPASAYNPLLGTFHTIDTSSSSPAQVINGNGRFRNIDEPENPNLSANGSGGDNDSSSNNDNRSVESEEQNKEKSNGSNKQEVIPGADNDKREKIRQKNERKHQRQKEKRAQELHERCNGYLMSRKLEALAQQLVGMGFSHERSTMALILNEGRIEQAVAWLFEAGEESDKLKDRNLDTGNNLKIDISEENSRIAEMELKFKCSRQEIERAIVSCEGDLEKSEESLRSQKHDQPASTPKPEETGNIRITQAKPNSTPSLPQRTDDKDLNYTKAPVMVGPTQKLVPKALQLVSRAQPNLEWTIPQQIATQSEKSWPVVGGAGSLTSVSYSLAPPVQVSPPPSKVESRYVGVGNEYKNLQPGSLKEPVVMMQRPQSANTKTAHVTRISSSPPGRANGNWYPPNSEFIKSNGFVPHIASTGSPSPNNLTSNQFCLPTQYQQQHQSFLLGSYPMDNSVSSRVTGSFSRMGSSSTKAFPPDSSTIDNSVPNQVNDLFPRMGSSSTQPFMPSSNPMDTLGLSRINDTIQRMGSSPTHPFTPGSYPMDNLGSGPVNDPFTKMGTSTTLSAASSLGLFSGAGSICSTDSTGLTSPVDWNANCSMPSCDYTSIDWSLDKSFLPAGPNSLWHGLGPYSRNTDHTYDVNLAMRPSFSNGNDVPIAGQQDGGAVTTDPSTSNSREWTSPFEGKDLFSLPRQIVFSPSL